MRSLARVECTAETNLKCWIWWEIACRSDLKIQWYLMGWLVLMLRQFLPKCHVFLWGRELQAHWHLPHHYQCCYRSNHLVFLPCIQFICTLGQNAWSSKPVITQRLSIALMIKQFPPPLKTSDIGARFVQPSELSTTSIILPTPIWYLRTR